MFIAKCDRCGKEKEIKSLVPVYNLDSEQPFEMPKYSIMKMENEIQTITLCKECEKEFDFWLHKYRKKEQNDGSKSSD